MWRSRTFWQLFGFFGLFWLAAAGLLEIVIVRRAEHDEYQQMEQLLHTQAVLIEEAVRGKNADPVDLQKRIVELGKQTGIHITLLNNQGKVQADSLHEPADMDNDGLRPEILRARDNGSGSDARRNQSGDDLFLYVALHTDRVEPEAAFVRAAVPLVSIEQRLDRLRWSVRIAAATTGAIVLILISGLALWLAQPLQELTNAAERIAAGSYGHKVYATSRDDVGILARTFNYMSERLAGQFAQLEEDRHQLRTILSGMVEGVIALDAEQRVLFANDRAAHLLEFPGRAAVGRKLSSVVRLRALQELLQRAIDDPEPQRKELQWKGAVSRSLTVHAARLPGKPSRGAVLVLHDTSELRRLERLRQEFVANVSHELKTPLSVIKACIETLIDGAVDDVKHRGSFLEQIDDQAERLHALILDLLSLSRIESGDEVFEIGNVSIEPAVTACLERHQARASAKNQILVAAPPGSNEFSWSATVFQHGAEQSETSSSQQESVGATSAAFSSVTSSAEKNTADFSGQLEIAAWADEEAVEQILGNLVDNAVKYTPEGGRIIIRWYAENNEVCLEVADSGIGIPEQDLPRIFERFYRVDKARSREMGGTGLGLSIVKHLVQAMHGSVSAISRLGRGTTFTVRLPRAPAIDIGLDN